MVTRTLSATGKEETRETSAQSDRHCRYRSQRLRDGATPTADHASLRPGTGLSAGAAAGDLSAGAAAGDLSAGAAAVRSPAGACPAARSRGGQRASGATAASATAADVPGDSLRVAATRGSPAAAGPRHRGLQGVGVSADRV